MKKILKLIPVFFMAILLFSCSNSVNTTIDEGFKSIKAEKIDYSKEPILVGLDELAKNFSYSIAEVKEEKDMAVAKVNLKAVDILYYLEEFFNFYINSASQEERVQKTEDYFGSLDLKDLHYVDKEVEVKLTKVDGKWKIDNLEEIKKIIRGGK